MRIWLVQLGEPLPTDEGRPRLLRTGLFARELAGRGHAVTYWTSQFDQRSHEMRHRTSDSMDSGEGYRIRLLMAEGYRKSFSVSRLLFNAKLASELRTEGERVAKLEGPPDVLVCGYPTPDLAAESARLAKLWAVSSVVDVRDLWPDVFAYHLPRSARVVTGLPMRLLRQRSRTVLSRFDAMVSITREILDWGIARAGPGACFRDGIVIPHSYPDPQACSEFATARIPLPIPDDALLLTYLGGLKDIVDFQTVLEALDCMRGARRVHVAFVGVGTAEARFRKLAASRPDVHFLGWQDMSGIRSLMNRTDIGFFCYKERFDYQMSVPNKVVEYLAWGKPVLSSVSEGPTARLISDWQCGACYPSGRVDRLASVLSDFASCPEQLPGMGKRARLAYESKFTVDHTVGRFADFIESL